MVGDLARDRLVLAGRRRADALVAPRVVGRDPLAAAREVVLPRELPRRLDRLRAAGDEEDAVEIAGRQGGELGGELDRARVRVRPVRVEGQLAHLLEGGLADLLAEAVAEVDGEETRERVEVAVALRVLEVAAVAADDDRHVRLLVAAHAGEVQPEMVARCLLEIDGRHVTGSSSTRTVPAATAGSTRSSHSPPTSFWCFVTATLRLVRSSPPWSPAAPGSTIVWCDYLFAAFAPHSPGVSQGELPVTVTLRLPFEPCESVNRTQAVLFV